MPELQTLLYEQRDGVAWVTLNRPDVLHAFDTTMQRELADTWRAVMRDDDVRCVVLTATGEKAFCVGIDREEAIDAEGPTAEGPGAEGPASEGPGASAAAAGSARARKPGYVTEWWFDDPGRRLGPKANDLWKPVIAAVNGMACGGAFYLLGEADFIIAADHATFFDPHVTYGMTAAFEPIHLLQKMPLQEVLRMALLGAHERMSARRAHEVGLVSEVVPKEELRDRAAWAAAAIASAPPLVVQGTQRAIWMANELPRSQALEQGYLYTNVGTDLQVLAESQRSFAAGRRVEWRLR